MGSIYHDAFVVIGANCAENSSSGFLEAKLMGEYLPLAQILNDDESLATVYMRVGHHHGCLIGPLCNDGRKGPLSDRGWALQEQLLSRRMVHFEVEEMFWECETAILCECLELEHLDEYAPQDGREPETSSIDYMTNWKSRLAIDMLAGNYKMWHSCVLQYLSRSLTVASDCLPALRGIITHLQNQGLGRNFAGLWEDALIHELAWTTTTAGRSDLTSRTAPSWSWACKQGSFVYGRFFSAEHDRFLPKCSAKYLGSTNVVQGGTQGRTFLEALQLRGKLVSLRERWQYNEATFSMELYETASGTIPWGRTSVFPDAWPVARESARSVFGTLLGQWPYALWVTEKSSIWIGIILRRTSFSTTADDKTFERVGIWKHEERGSLQKLHRRKGHETNVDASQFFETMKEETVTIV